RGVLEQQLPAASAGHDDLAVAVDADELGQQGAAAAHQLRDQPALGAQRHAVGGVLDVAAGHEPAVVGAGGGADAVAGVRRVGAQHRGVRLGPQPRPVAAHRAVSPAARVASAAWASTRAPIGTAPSSMRRSPWCRSYVGPPGVRVPSRPNAPGTTSTYHAKSSPPRLCWVGTRPAGPSAASTAVPSRPAEVASLTTGGTPRW